MSQLTLQHRAHVIIQHQSLNSIRAPLQGLFFLGYPMRLIYILISVLSMSSSLIGAGEMSPSQLFYYLKLFKSLYTHDERSYEILKRSLMFHEDNNIDGSREETVCYLRYAMSRRKRDRMRWRTVSEPAFGSEPHEVDDSPAEI